MGRGSEAAERGSLRRTDRVVASGLTRGQVRWQQAHAGKGELTIDGIALLKVAISRRRQQAILVAPDYALKKP